ncbi:DMT family transporter [Actibacterium sp. XHP0104]|uniref:DMT family transporter n=1 Tax=Actibacterium sp. XHP0104 TaxID=2984335 RepID=UPI0021E7C6B8|nr:DMT family transporter [Actibacterium sp. XHP0104]MCV2881029.1 DMT family transporter [Actibacterium sp. XHP0104]
MSATRPLPAILLAALWMAGTIASFSAMAVAGRHVRVELDTFELMTTRSLVGLLIVLTVAASRGTWRQISTDRLGLHLARNICHFTGQNLWFFALPLIPLAQLFALEFTTPLWVTLLAPLLLAETLTRTKLIAALIGFAGVLVITHPDPAQINPGTIAAALCAIGFAGSVIFTKRLTRTATITCIMFWLTGMQAVFGLICGFADGQFTWPSTAILHWVVIVGCAGLAGHFCLTQALHVAPASIVMPMDFVRLPVIALVGLALYDEPLEWALLLGGVLIFGGNLMNIRHESRARRLA